MGLLEEKRALLASRREEAEREVGIAAGLRVALSESKDRLLAARQDAERLQDEIGILEAGGKIGGKARMSAADGGAPQVAAAGFFPPSGEITAEMAAAMLGGKVPVAPLATPRAPAASPTFSPEGSPRAGGAGQGAGEVAGGGEGGKKKKKKNKKKKKGGGDSAAATKLHESLDKLSDAAIEGEDEAFDTEFKILEARVKGERAAVEAALDVPGGGEGLFPLHKAVLMDDPDCRVLSLLLGLGADVDCRDDHGNTPLVVAPYFSAGAEMCKVLLDNGADVNAAGDEGNTALMSASESLNAAAVELLMDRGADENKKNNEGKLALQLVLENDDPEVPQWSKAQCAGALGGEVSLKEMEERIDEALTSCD